MISGNREQGVAASTPGSRLPRCWCRGERAPLRPTPRRNWSASLHSEQWPSSGLDDTLTTPQQHLNGQRTGSCSGGMNEAAEDGERQYKSISIGNRYGFVSRFQENLVSKPSDSVSLRKKCMSHIEGGSIGPRF